ncbi:Transcription factor [uncultured virus]|nr:Transcription factor [uncultured virus]
MNEINKNMNYDDILSPEIESGNVEYKRILHMNFNKIKKLKSQMLWRLDEGKKLCGNEEAIYYIGIEDDGMISGISIDEINSSLDVLKEITKMCKAEIDSINIINKDEKLYCKAIVKKFNLVKINEELRVIFLGNSGTGKTTFLGVLVNDILDNGKGSARSNVFRFNNEIKFGYTTSIKYEIIGFNDNELINYNSIFVSDWEDIITKSKKIITLIDLPGNLKFLKTILFGITSNKPNYIVLFINPTNMKNCIFYLELCKKINIPLIIVITKFDLIEHQDINIYKKITEIYKNKNIVHIDNPELISNFDFDNNIPICSISNVTGKNIDLLKKILGKLPIVNYFNKQSEDNIEFLTTDKVFIPEIGTILIGILLNGTLKLDDYLYMGPININSGDKTKSPFYKVKIVSIHKKKIPTNILNMGESGSLIIKYDEPNFKLNKHLMLLNDKLLKNFVNKFVIKIQKKDIQKNILLKIDHPFMINIGNIYSQINIYQIEDNEKFILIFVNFKNNEVYYVKDNDLILIRFNNNIINGISYHLINFI